MKAAAVLFVAAFVMSVPVRADDAVAPAIVAELKAMDDADCAASRAGNFPAFEKTLAPEYVSVNVDGSRDDRASVVAYFSKPSVDRVTGCSTIVRKVTRDGNVYHVYATYTEDGTRGPKHVAYHNVEQIRDAWKRAGSRWLQTGSITYAATMAQGGKTEYFVLPPAKGGTVTSSSMVRPDCFTWLTIARRVALPIELFPNSVKNRTGDAFADVEVAILSDGTRCGPKIVKTSGNLPTDNAAISAAYNAYLGSVKANGGKSIGAYLYHVRFAPAQAP